jgi:hypothetical protein
VGGIVTVPNWATKEFGTFSRRKSLLLPAVGLAGFRHFDEQRAATVAGQFLLSTFMGWNAIGCMEIMNPRSFGRAMDVSLDG